MATAGTEREATQCHRPYLGTGCPITGPCLLHQAAASSSADPPQCPRCITRLRHLLLLLPEVWSSSPGKAWPDAAPSQVCSHRCSLKPAGTGHPIHRPAQLPGQLKERMIIILCVDSSTAASVWEMQALGAAIGCHILGKQDGNGFSIVHNAASITRLHCVVLGGSQMAKGHKSQKC